MVGFYKLCISRFGLILGHGIFFAVFGYIAGIVMLYLIGGAEHVSFKPMVVWNYLYTQWNYWTAHKDDLDPAFFYKFFGALIAPFVFGFTVKLIFKFITWPFREMKKRRDAKKPKPVTAEERLQNIESKLDALKEEMATKEESEETPSTPEELQENAHTPSQKEEESQHKEASPVHITSSATVADDEVIITPPPPKEEPTSSSHHPDSVSADFASKPRSLKPEDGENKSS